MAGTITNVINTVFKTKGAEQTEKATTRVGRAQTRLGQASASAGREFSAQASGLGGLVGAYAGAAATVFALEAAFQALAQAAAAENIVKGTNVLAASVGQVGPQLISQIKEITNNQVTLAEAAQNANIALSTGFSSEQILGLTEVANKAARTLGRDLTDSFQRLVRGTSKLEPELLDELGIFVRLDPAVRKYAEEIGKAANELNEFERRQAFANAAIEEGTRKFGIIDTSAESVQKSLEQLRVSVSEAFTSFLQAVSKVLVPFVDYINNDLGASLVFFGGLLSLIFGKALQELGSFASGGILAIDSFANKLSVRAESAKGNFSDLNKEVEKLNETIEKRGSLSAGGGRFQQGIPRDIATEAARARTRFRSGDPLSAAERTRDINILKSAQVELTKTVGTQNNAYRDATAIINAYTTANNKATISVKLLSAASQGLIKFASGVTKVISVLTRALNGLFILTAVTQLVDTIFGINILDSIINKFKELTSAAEETKRGFVSLVAAADGADLTAKFKLIDPKATSADVEKTVTSVRKLVTQEINSINAEIKALEKSVFGGVVPEELVKNLEASRDPLLIINKLIEERNKTIAKGTEGLFATEAGLESARKEKAALESLLISYEKFGVVSPEIARSISQVSDALGISGQTIATIFSEANKGLLSLEDGVVRIAGLEFSNFSELDARTKQFVLSFISVSNTVDVATKSFLAGSTSAEQLSKQIVGAREQLRKAKDAGEDFGGLGILESDIKRLERYRDILFDVESDIKNINSAFSRQIKLTDDLEWGGLLSLQGEFADTEEDIRRNQIARLAVSIAQNSASKEQLDSLNKALKSNEQLTEEQAATQAKQEAYNKAIDAGIGLLIEGRQELSKIVKEQEKQLAIVKEQNELRQQELDIDILKERFALANAIAELEQSRAENALKLEEARLSTQETILDNIIKQGEALTAIDQAALARAAPDIQALAAEQQTGFVPSVQEFVATVDTPAIQAAAAELKSAFDSGIDRQQALINFQIAATEQLQQKELANFDAQTRLQQEAIAADFDVIVQKQAILQAEVEFKKAEIQARRSAIEAEAGIVKAQINGYAILAEVINAQAKGIGTMGEVVNNFNEGINALISGLSQFLANLPEELGGPRGGIASRAPVGAPTSVPLAQVGGPDYGPPGIGGPTDIVTQVLGLQGQALSGLEDLTEARLESLNIEEAALDNITKLKLEQYDTEKAKLIELYGATADLRAEERRQLIAEQRSVVDALANDLVQAGVDAAGAGAAGGAGSGTEQELSKQAERLKSIYLSVFDGVQSAIETSLTGVKDYILYGEGNLRDVFVNLLRSIGDTILEQGFIKPLSENLAGTVFGAITGVQGGREGVENMFKPDGTANNPVYVTSATGPLAGVLGGVTPTPTADAAAQSAEGGGFFSNIFNSIKTGFTNLFGEGGILSSLLSNFGGFVSNIFGGILKFVGSIFGLGFASGGLVHRAGGGSIPQLASGGGLRDRVPALLEPGEFVLRRAAANRIGMSNLQQMNATGQAPGAAPVINITNEGTAKTAETSQPRFDGEKYVIDIVTRDLQNNGPIRRSLRSGV